MRYVKVVFQLVVDEELDLGDVHQIIREAKLPGRVVELADMGYDTADDEPDDPDSG